MQRKNVPGFPLTYFNDGGPSDFFGSKLLAKSDFFRSMKNTRIFLGCVKRTKGFFGV